MTKKVNIIGAGLAGLSAGVYLQKEGIETEIFELAPWPGGVCTAWVRNGYRFDGCIHWMVGTKPGPGFYQLYREIDALREDTVIYNSQTLVMEIGGASYDIPMKIGGFKSLLLEISPQDSAAVNELCRDIDIVSHSGLPGWKPENLREWLALLKGARGLNIMGRKYLGLTMAEVAGKFRSQTLKELLLALMPGEYSAAGLIMMLGERMAADAGYPLGGASEMIARIEAKYRLLGGKINYNTKVEELIIENDRVSGLRTKGGSYPADAVVAACDAYDTLKNMLGDNFPHPQLDKMLGSSLLFEPLALVSFGLDKRFGIPSSIYYQCPEGIETAPGVFTKSIGARSLDFDPTAAPEGCSSVMVMLAAPLDYWQNLRTTDLETYKKEKGVLAGRVADFLESRLPGFKDAIKVTDVATPATYVRLANLHQASFEGFAPTPTALKTRISMTIPGLANLVMCGQWTTAGGGICTAVKSGKDAATEVKKLLR